MGEAPVDCSRTGALARWQDRLARPAAALRTALCKDQADWDAIELDAATRAMLRELRRLRLGG